MSKVEVRPSQHEIDVITANYGKITAAEIADLLEVSVNRVYNICRYLELGKCNKRFIFTVQQYQLILAGILGDGNIKRNGSNFYYRETHSKKEKEYCKWKHDILIDFISKKGFGITDKRDGQYGFQTMNSVTFRSFKAMTKGDVIAELNRFGVLVYLLDDGWRRDSGYALCTGVLTDDEVRQLKDKIDSLFNTDVKIISHQTISIRKADIIKMLPYFKKYIPADIDIYQHKIQPLCNKYKV